MKTKSLFAWFHDLLTPLIALPASTKPLATPERKSSSFSLPSRDCQSSSVQNSDQRFVQESFRGSFRDPAQKNTHRPPKDFAQAPVPNSSPEACQTPPHPCETLMALGFEPRRYPWLETLTDEHFPLIERPGAGMIPDVQSRTRSVKRRSGQFFTPESLVGELLDETGIIKDSGRVLDPACGDGAFLVPAARRRQSLGAPVNLGDFYGYDIDPTSLLICLGRLLAAFPHSGLPGLECRNFLREPPGPLFDVVLGNPPYKVNLEDDLKELLRQRFETAEGEKDVYTFFLEGAVKALVPGGSLCLLTSHTYLVNHQCRLIRAFLFGKYAARRLFLLPPAFFPTARGVLPVVLELQKQPFDDRPVQLYDDYQPSRGWNSRRKGDARELLQPTGLRRLLGDPRWRLLFEKMETGTRRLGDIARIGVGIQESTVRAETISRFVTETWQPGYEKVLKGKEISAFAIHWEGKFLNYGPHLTYAGNPTLFRGQKILYQNIRHESLPVRLVATLDSQGFFPKNSLSYIVEPDPPFALEYLVALLNSPIVNCWFREQYFSFHITVTQVRTIPIPLPPEKLRQEIEMLSQSLMTSNVAAEKRQTMSEELSELVLQAFFPGPADLALARQLLHEAKMTPQGLSAPKKKSPVHL